jgi:hypothetical protein
MKSRSKAGGVCARERLHTDERLDFKFILFHIMGSYEHSTETSGSIKAGGFLE